MIKDVRHDSPIPDPANQLHTGRDPEDRPVRPEDGEKLREKMMDKTLADSYPASDPPSSIPDPWPDESSASEDDKAA